MVRSTSTTEQPIAPTHLVADYDSGRTCCGIKLKSDKALPFVAVEHAQAHVEGHGIELCPECQV